MSKHKGFSPLTLYKDGTDLDRIIAVSDIPNGVDEDDLVEYIEDVCSCNVKDIYFSEGFDHVALVKLIEPIEVLENILSRRHSPCGYSIDVEPYYHPFHDQIVSLLKNKRINDIDRGSSSEESSIDENYFYCNDDSNDLSDQSSSSEHSYNPRQPKIFSDDQQSDKSSDSSLESARDARQRKTRGCKLTRDYESVPINMDNICEHEEDKILLAKIFKDSVGESFKDYLERKHDCTIDIEFITKDGATNRNKNGATGRQTGSKKGQKVKSGLVASSQDQLRQANHLPIHVDFPQVRRILSANELAFLSIRSPISFSEPRKGSKSTAQDYRENIFQFGSSTISIKLGNITKEKAEVIVNVVGPDMDYNGNRITSSIVRAGGKSVAKMLDKHSGDAIFKTGSGNLPCDKIYTLTLDTYRGKRSEKIYRETIEECLNDARNDQIKSISFPIIGYGRAFKYPKTFVLETLVSQIILEIENPANKFLKISISSLESFRVA